MLAIISTHKISHLILKAFSSTFKETSLLMDSNQELNSNNILIRKKLIVVPEIDGLYFIIYFYPSKFNFVCPNHSQ